MHVWAPLALVCLLAERKKKMKLASSRPVGFAAFKNEEAPTEEERPAISMRIRARAAPGNLAQGNRRRLPPPSVSPSRRTDHSPRSFAFLPLSLSLSSFHNGEIGKYPKHRGNGRITRRGLSLISLLISGASQTTALKTLVRRGPDEFLRAAKFLLTVPPVAVSSHF